MDRVEDLKFWFITGSQFLYGPDTLLEVERDSKAIVEALNDSGEIPCEIIYKDTVKTSEEITSLIKEANYNNNCAGVIVFMHTFSPSKMWINGLSLLQKPYLHFHTQFTEIIPNEAIDMDYMNLHQSAHGDREHGFIGARMRYPRKIVVGHWLDENVQRKIGKWVRSAVGVFISKNMKVMRFGDNMRDVAVTEGDKVGVQMKLGWEVNTWPVGLLVERMGSVSKSEIARKVDEYKSLYTVNDPHDLDAIEYQAREEIAIKGLMDEEACIAFTNTFENLYGMNQLPGLATQNLMRQGYGYGGEGDWKISALTALMKKMSFGLDGGTSFMEDYTYDLKEGLSLGAHMLEVCLSIAANKARIEVHPLNIGDREPPARLVFEGKAGSAIVASLIDIGGRLRMIVQDINCVKPSQTMPNLPIARVMWRPEPSLTLGAECWILAGGAHHTALSYDCDAEIMRDWARMMDIEFVHISKDTDPTKFEQELMLSDFVWHMRR
ncbi:MAG: L-arabinose isomerase [Fastidiosipila sp.]|nr:L-arabinose isomerase [Fastidiosipila sp.]